MNELTTFDIMEGRTRELIDIGELRDARKAGWLVEDRERRRPRYFDGRFLTAKDLTRDQDYLNRRQIDLGRMSGGGVVVGLELALGSNFSQLKINPGHGITPSGELVVLLEEVTVDVSDVPTIQNFDAIFGLEVRPNAPIRNRSGLFAIALRNVEYTANPVATYPSDLQAERRIEDGDIIEGTAITMIPFESVAPSDLDQSGRARVAREIFLRKLSAPASEGALPIGVVSLERGVVQWVDQYLVRRDASVDDSLGFGVQHRSVREAFLRQYQQHLIDIRQIRADNGQTGPFAASEHFQALPPFGPVPVEALQRVGTQLVQSYFPAEFDVELTIIPDDELAALQEEAVTMPAIDLRASASVLEQTSVLMLLPIPRADFATFVSRLEGRLSRFPVARASRPRARRSVVDTLSSLRLLSVRRPLQSPLEVNLQPWEDALNALGTGPDSLFYVRRRRLSQVSFSFPRFQTFPPDSPNPSETLSNDVRERLIHAGELIRDDASPLTPTPTTRFEFIGRRTTNEALIAVEALLSKPLFQIEATGPFIDDLFVNGVVAELAYRTVVRLDDLVVSSQARQSVIDTGDGVVAAEGSEPIRVRALTVNDVKKIADRYSRTGLRQGFALLVAARPQLLQVTNRNVLAESFRIPELDAQALRLSQLSNQEFNEFAAELLEHALAQDIGAIRDMVDLRFAPPDVDSFPPIPGFPGSQVAINVGEGRLYHIIHIAAAGDAALRTRLSNLLMRPLYDQPMIVSSVLAQLLIEALSLTFPGPATPGAPGQIDLVNNVLEALSRFDLSDQSPFRVPGNGSQTGGVLSATSDVLNIFTEYETLELEPRLGLLTETVEDAGYDRGLDGYRTIGFATQTVRLIKRLLAADAGQIGPLVNAIKAALDNNAGGLGRIVQLAFGAPP